MTSVRADNDDDFKIPVESDRTICRCCLSREKRMKDIRTCSLLFRDLTGIEILESDGLPHWMCLECSYLLEKSVRFKHKVMKAHDILYEYLTRCAPFPIDAQDPELGKYSTPPLSVTDVLAYDNSGRSRQGFHKVLEHVKLIHKTELSVKLKYDPQVKSESADGIPVKEEGSFSDYDDNIPLDEYRSSQVDKVEQISEQEFSELLHGSEGVELEVRAEKRRKKGKKGEKEKKRRKTDSGEMKTESPRTSVRKPIEIDPAKIMTIKLNPDEQVKMRNEMSRDPGYLKFPFKCELCYKGFNHQNKLENHMKKHSPSRGKFQCHLCSMYLPTIYSYNVHELTHTTRYECLRCGRRMVDRASIVDHYGAAHEGLVKQYNCHLCGKISHNNKTHRGHMRNHHSGDRPKCEECGKTFVNRDSLNDHMLIHQGIKNHECDTCGKRFRTKTQVKHHQLKHSDSKDFYCVECDTRFKSEHNLRQHLAKSVKHRDKSTLKFPCSRCELRFASAAARAHHEAFRHEGLRAHACATCGAALATRNSLHKHVRAAHLGYRAPLKHVCDACGKAFRSKNILMNHVRTHTGEKPFECAHCGRKFTQRTAMATHVKLVHLKLKRNAKIKETQDVKVTKEEVPIVFESWNRTPALHSNDFYFTVSTGP